MFQMGDTSGLDNREPQGDHHWISMKIRVQVSFHILAEVRGWGRASGALSESESERTGQDTGFRRGLGVQECACTHTDTCTHACIYTNTCMPIYTSQAHP